MNEKKNKLRVFIDSNVLTPENLSSYKTPYIRDPADLPILVTAIFAQPDIFITGDKDFHTEEIRSYLPVHTPNDFLRRFT